MNRPKRGAGNPLPRCAEWEPFCESCLYQINPDLISFRTYFRCRREGFYRFGIVPDCTKKSLKMSVSQEEIALLLACGPEADMKDMIARAKLNFVTAQHNRAITCIAKGRKAGRWKTYVGVGKDSKEVIRTTEQELYDFLYEYYREQSKTNLTFREAFGQKEEYKLEKLNRTAKTIETDRLMYRRFIPDDFGKQKLAAITTADVLELVSSAVREQHPKQDTLRRFLQLVSSTFQYGMSFGLCTNNPAAFVDLRSYFKDCEHNQKHPGQKEFSQTEIQQLQEAALKDQKNPRALMLLLAAATGMRVAELAALKWEDIEVEYLHIHRQQINDRTKGHAASATYDVEYTKDERLRPDDGRLFPLNFPSPVPIPEILEMAKAIPGKSDYIFHDSGESRAVCKDTYERYLSRKCRTFGLELTRNHGFRRALNSRMIEMKLSPAARAYLLGHSVETNERFYSLTGKYRLEEINRILRPCG